MEKCYSPMCAVKSVSFVYVHVDRCFKMKTPEKERERETEILTMSLCFTARDDDNVNKKYTGYRKVSAHRDAKVACIRYGRGIMRLTFIGRTCNSSQPESELFAGPSRNLVSLFQFGSDCSRLPASNPHLSNPLRLHLASLFRFLAFLGSGARKIYKAGQEFPAPPTRREKRIV